MAKWTKAAQIVLRRRNPLLASGGRHWYERIALSSLARFKRLHWLDHAIFVRIGLSPRLLSTEMRQSPGARTTALTPALAKLQAWLWQRHSARRAAGAAITCLGVLVTIAWLTSWSFSLNDADGGDSTATLNTLAQVAGGIFATVVTVVVFAIGLVAQRPDGGWAYMPFVARRHHVFLVAALSASLALANSIVPSIAFVVGPGATFVLLQLNTVLLPLIGIQTIVLMCKVIESASGSDIDATLPVFEAAMARIAEADRRDGDLQIAFEARLNGTGIKISPLAGHWPRRKGDEHRFLGAPFSTHVLDVDLAILRELTTRIAGLSSALEWSFLTAPASPGDDRGVMFVRYNPRTSEESRSADRKVPAPPTLAELLPEDCAARLGALLDRLFITGAKRPHAQDTRQFFQRMEADLLRLARAGDAVLLERRLEEYTTLLQTWLRVAGPDTVPRRSAFTWKDQPFAGPLEIDIYDLIRSGARSESPEVLEKVVNAIARIMRDARSSARPSLYRDAARMLGFACYTAIRIPSLRIPAEQLFDRWLNAIGGSFKILRFRYSTDHDKDGLFVEEQPYLDSYLGAALFMIRAALESGDTPFASTLVTRITRDLEERHHTHNQTAPSEESGKTVLQYATLVAFAWALHLNEHQHPHQATAERISQDLISILPARHELIALWELYHGDSTTRSEIDARLGVDHWDLDEGDRRVGFVYTTTGSDWILTGLHAALLVAREPLDFEIRAYFTQRPRRYLWDVQGLSERLTHAAKLLPRLDSESKATAITEVSALIAQRHRVAEAAVLRAMATQPLSTDRIEGLRQGIEDGLNQHRVWPRLIQALGGLAHDARVRIAPTRRRVGVHRDSLVPVNNWGDGYGRMLGEDMAKLEAMEIVHAIEQAREFDMPVTSLIDLPGVVRNARQTLADAGFVPTLLVLPPFDRFPSALFDQPLWRLSKPPAAGHETVGVWEGLTVVRCPYENTTSVLLLDVGAVYGASPSSLEFSHSDTPEETKRQFVDRATDDGTDPLPKSDDLRVETRISVTSPVGLRDISGARRLDIRSSDACFAMLPGEPEYHRPTCELVNDGEHVKFSLSKHLDDESDDRAPCKICRPERWDFDVRKSV